MLRPPFHLMLKEIENHFQTLNDSTTHRNPWDEARTVLERKSLKCIYWRTRKFNF